MKHDLIQAAIRLIFLSLILSFFIYTAYALFVGGEYLPMRDWRAAAGNFAAIIFFGFLFVRELLGLINTKKTAGNEDRPS